MDMSNSTKWKLLVAGIILTAMWTGYKMHDLGYFNDKSVGYNIDFPEVE